MPIEKLSLLYTQMDALLFPFYMETFGAPLIEVSSVGLLIIVADRPFAHDVIGGYEGVKFVAFDNAAGWANEIMVICNRRMRVG